MVGCTLLRRLAITHFNPLQAGTFFVTSSRNLRVFNSLKDWEFHTPCCRFFTQQGCSLSGHLVVNHMVMWSANMAMTHSIVLISKTESQSSPSKISKTSQKLEQASKTRMGSSITNLKARMRIFQHSSAYIVFEPIRTPPFSTLGDYVRVDNTYGGKKHLEGKTQREKTDPAKTVAERLVRAAGSSPLRLRG
jgi:hypothetical protein